MLTHLPLRDSGTMTTSITPCPGHRCFDECHFSSAGFESSKAIHARHSYTNLAHERRRLPQTSGAYHFDSSQPTHLQCPRITASQPPRFKPYCTNRSEEVGLTWSFASSPAVYNKGVDTVRKNSKFYRERQRFDHVSWSSSGCYADSMATQYILNPRINYST